MICPGCKEDNHNVLETRKASHDTLRRRRRCNHCWHIWTTHEIYKTSLENLFESHKVIEKLRILLCDTKTRQRGG